MHVGSSVFVAIHLVPLPLEVLKLYTVQVNGVDVFQLFELNFCIVDNFVWESRIRFL